MKVDYMRLVNYVNTASDLAEGIAEDLKTRKGRISSGSVVNLGRFFAASRAVQYLLDSAAIDKKDIQ